MTLAELRREQAEPVLLADQQGSILHLNAPFTAAFGWTAEELSGRSLTLLIPARLRDAYHLALARFLRQENAPGSSPPVTVFALAKDGRELSAELRLVAEKTGAGWVFGAAIRAQSGLAPRRSAPSDLEDRLEQQRSTLGRLESALEALDEPLVLADAQGRVLWCTNAAVPVLGRPAIEALGRPVSDVLPQPGRFSAKPFSAGGGESGTLYRLRDEGAPSEDLRRQVADLSAASKDLEAFGYSIAHELRTPLRGIRLFTKALLQEHAHELSGDGGRILGVIHDNGERMARLIDELLEFSRLGHKPILLAEVDMGDLAAGVWNDLRSLAEGRKVAVDFQPLPPACGDPTLLRQVLVNLFSNALKFTARTGEARIEVGGGTEAGHTVYCVRDNGIGFDMADAGKLFGVFSRLNAADEFEGAGVGLALVQRIVQRHGGRVWAEGRSGAGAAFYFSLPQAAHAAHNGGGHSVSVPA